ncbi:MAG TPA: ThuA domain-containing protein [Tepidisphaeraceae bacterium]|jgi:hypothetical protein
MRPRIIFHVGGPDFHPSSEQAATIIDWLGGGFACHRAEGLAAFEHLNECDLLVLMGMWWTGFEGRYRAPSEVHRRSLEKYVHSGRPVLSAHAAIASYDDWPRFGELTGFTWVWGDTSHSLIAEHHIRIIPTHHPIVEGVGDFNIVDELYYDIRLSPGMDVMVHAASEWAGKRVPIVLTAEGGRIQGAGKSVYLVNGHDMRAFESPELRQIWLNAIRWCIGS